MITTDNMHDKAHERSPKRRRIDSDSPDPLSRDRHQLYNSAPQQSHNGTAYNTDADTDADNHYAYEDESDGVEPSNLNSPAVQDGASTPQPPTRPLSLHYTPHMTLRGHKRGVAAVKFSPNGKYIASCSADCTVKIWNAQTGALIHNLEGHLGGVSTLTWNPDSTVLASGSDDKSIRLWDVVKGKCLSTPLIGHHNHVYSIAFSPKGNMLVSGSYDEAVFLWDVRTARVMRSLPAHSDPVSGVDFVRDGTLVASCSSDGLIRIWDSTTGQCLKTLVHEDNAPVTSVKFSPNGKFVLATTLDSCVRLWKYVEGRCVKTYQGHSNSKHPINACFGTYTAEGTKNEADESKQEWAFAACGDESGRTVIWDVNSKEVLQVLEGHDGPVLGVDTSLLNDAIVTCGHDGTVRVWKRAAKAETNGIGHNPPEQDRPRESNSPKVKDSPKSKEGEEVASS